MLILILVSIIVFVGVFYLANLLYPSIEKQTIFWHKKKVDQITPRVDHMFLDISANRLIFLDIAAPVVCAALAYFLTHNRWVTLAAAGIGLIIPMSVVKFLEKRRRKKFGLQLVDAIMIICSSLKVGLSFQQTFEVVVNEMAPPISQEFALLLRQMQMGFSLEGALKDLKKRMAIDDLDMLISALMVAKETGGDVTDTLNKVSNTITERNKILGKVKALTVQAKLQGVIMSLIPFAFGYMVYKADPNFFDVFFTTDLGRILFTYACISQVLGIFFIIKLSKVDV